MVTTGEDYLATDKEVGNLNPEVDVVHRDLWQKMHNIYSIKVELAVRSNFTEKVQEATQRNMGDMASEATTYHTDIILVKNKAEAIGV